MCLKNRYLKPQSERKGVSTAQQNQNKHIPTQNGAGKDRSVQTNQKRKIVNVFGRNQQPYTVLNMKGIKYIKKNTNLPTKLVNKTQGGKNQAKQDEQLNHRAYILLLPQ